MSTIPVSQIVQIVPGVITAGGAASKLTGVVVTQDTSILPGQYLDFFAKEDVAAWFGPTSAAATIANNYFPGIVNAGQLPYDLAFCRYSSTATPAAVYGAKLSLTLAELKTHTGTLVVTTATTHTSSTIDLSTATDFANAASLMLAAFTSPDFTITYDAQRQRYLVETSATGSTATITAITGTLADAVGLSAAAGASLQATGTDADASIGDAVNRLLQGYTNFGTLTTDWEPDLADRLALAQWNSGENYQFIYVAYDMDAASIVVNNAASFGAQVFAAPYQGTLPVYGTAATAGAMMGWAASVNYNLPNGRTTLAFRQFNAGTPATATDLPTANALLSNNYTYIGAYANQANNYTVAYDGKMSGAFLWADTYLNQIYLNRELQRANFETLLAYRSIPYNQDGYTALYNGSLPVAQAALTSGIIRAGVTLTSSQMLQVDTAAGRTISDTLQTIGWYLLVTDPANPGQARQNRTSPFMAFWYCDGGSVQKINLNSTAVI